MDSQLTTIQESENTQEAMDLSTAENTANTTQVPVSKATAPAALPDSTTLPPPPPVNTHQLMHSYRPPGHLTQPYLLEQLKDVQNHTAQAIFRLEDYWSRGSVDALSRLQKQQSDANPTIEESFSASTTVEESSVRDIQGATRPLKTLLELMGRHLRAAIEAMARPRKEKLYPFRVCDPKVRKKSLRWSFYCCNNLTIDIFLDILDLQSCFE